MHVIDFASLAWLFLPGHRRRVPVAQCESLVGVISTRYLLILRALASLGRCKLRSIAQKLLISQLLTHTGVQNALWQHGMPALTIQLVAFFQDIATQRC